MCNYALITYFVGYSVRLNLYNQAIKTYVDDPTCMIHTLLCYECLGGLPTSWVIDPIVQYMHLKNNS